MTIPAPRHIVVVGGGMAGLVAARDVARAGCTVTLLESSDRLGGQVLTRDIAGTRLDVGAEAMHLGSPAVGALLDDLSLRDDMITAGGGTSWIATPRGLRRLPAGVGPAGPTRLRPVLASGAMTVGGLARAGLEPARALTVGGLDLREGRDVSVASFVTSRFGPQVTETFVDPLLGSLHAGDVRRLSLRATAPSLVPAARAGESILLRSRARARSGQKPPPMSFITWADGLDRVVTTLVSRLNAAGVTMRLRTAVTSVVSLSGARESGGCASGLRESGPGESGSGEAGSGEAGSGEAGSGEAGSGEHEPLPAYAVTLADGSTLVANGVVLAVPARVAADLLSGIAPEATGALRQTETASVATMVLGFSRPDVTGLDVLRGTGVLVPSAEGSLLKAATFLSTKWPHLRGGSTYWMRLSAGRAGDERLSGLDDSSLLDHVRRDLRRFTGFDVHPSIAHVERWPQAMPQLTVGHPDRMAMARRALAGVGGPASAGGPANGSGRIALAGASYDGIGLAACIASGSSAAALVLGDPVSDPSMPTSAHPSPPQGMLRKDHS